MKKFVTVDGVLIDPAAIVSVDISDLGQGRITVTHHYNGDMRTAKAEDFDAFEIIMMLSPSAVEGRPLRFARHAWAFHNLVAHPLMQILAWTGFKKTAIRLHDATVPRPTGVRGGYR